MILAPSLKQKDPRDEEMFMFGRGMRERREPKNPYVNTPLMVVRVSPDLPREKIQDPAQLQKIKDHHLRSMEEGLKTWPELPNFKKKMHKFLKDHLQQNPFYENYDIFDEMEFPDVTQKNEFLVAWLTIIKYE